VISLNYIFSLNFGNWNFDTSKGKENVGPENRFGFDGEKAGLLVLVMACKGFLKGMCSQAS
jgi:hypothetical protein